MLWYAQDPILLVMLVFLSRFLYNPSKDHWQVAKWILRYLSGTSRMFLCFGSGDHVLDGYTNAYMTCDIDSRKFTSESWWLLQGERYLGNQGYKSVLLNLLTRLSILQQLKHIKNFCRWINSYKSWELSKRSLCCYVAVRVQFILVRTLRFIPNQRTLRYDVIGYKMPWRQSCFHSRRSILTRMV